MKIVVRILKFDLLVFLCLATTTCVGPPKIGAYSANIIYDTTHNRYLAVYAKRKTTSNETTRIYGRVVNADGTFFNEEFVISGDDELHCPTASYDVLNNRFLVVWNNTNAIKGQIISGDGSILESSFELSGIVEDFNGRHCPVTVHDDANNSYLVLWDDQLTLKNDSVNVQRVDDNGILVGQKIKVSDDGTSGSLSAITFDSDNRRYLIAWSAVVTDQNQNIIKGQIMLPDGTLSGDPFVIADAGDMPVDPALSYDNVNKRFLAVWRREAEGKSSLRGQLLTGDGSRFNTMLDISDPDRFPHEHTVIFNGTNQRYFVLYGDYTKNGLIFGQVVTPEGSRDTTLSSNNVLLSYPNFPGESSPSIAFNSNENNFLVVWEYLLKDSVYGDKEKYADIHGRLVTADGEPAAPIFIISNGGQW